MSKVAFMLSLYDYVTQGLQGREAEWPEAAKSAGVHEKTVQRIARGEVANPGVRTMEELAVWLKRNPKPPQRRAAA